VSAKYPIISVTGSSGAGTTSVRRTFEQIFHRERIEAAYIEGDAFNPTAPLAAIRPKR
jgi:phosphoribulokinase